MTIEAGVATIRIPGNTPAGEGYRIRVRTTEPPTEALSPTTLTVHPRPNLQFAVSATEVLEGAAVTITNNTADGETESFSWDFDGATPATSDAADPGDVTWSEEGARTVRLEGVNALGCGRTVTQVVNVYSCNPRIPGNADVITGEASNGGGARNVWVCDGGSYSAGGGSYSIYIEPGGTFTRTGGGLYTFYVPEGATYNGSSAGSTILIRDPNANTTGVSDHIILECPDGITFDTTNAPEPGCP